MLEAKLTIRNQAGLHARPASLFVQTAAKFRSDISLVKDKPVNAKSILSVLAQGIHAGESVTVRAQGPDEKEAITALEQLAANNFGEE